MNRRYWRLAAVAVFSIGLALLSSCAPTGPVLTPVTVPAGGTIYTLTGDEGAVQVLGTTNHARVDIDTTGLSIVQFAAADGLDKAALCASVTVTVLSGAGSPVGCGDPAEDEYTPAGFVCTSGDCAATFQAVDDFELTALRVATVYGGTDFTVRFEDLYVPPTTTTTEAPTTTTEAPTTTTVAPTTTTVAPDPDPDPVVVEPPLSREAVQWIALLVAFAAGALVVR